MPRIFYAVGKRLPLYIAVLAGITVALFAWYNLNKQVRQTQTTVKIVVPKEDIEAYSVLSPEKLTAKEVLRLSVDKYTAQEIGDASGMLTTAPLYAGKSVDTRYLAKPNEDVGSYQVVGVNIDAARAAGVKTGDIVDVYWLNPEQIAWAPAQTSQLIANNVRVLRVCDDRGQAITEKTKTIQASVGSVVTPIQVPRIVYLLVKPEDVPLIIGGSATKSASIALARKSSETTGGINSGFLGTDQREENTAPAGTGTDGTSNGKSGGSGKAGSGASVSTERR